MTPSKQFAVSAASGAGNAATSNGGAGLHSLPNEIVDTICACLTFESLKNFRLVSQNYEPPTKKYLYQTFVLWRTNTSWQKLGSIAGTPELAVFEPPKKDAEYRLTTFEDRRSTPVEKQKGYEAYTKWFNAEAALPLCSKRVNFYRLGQFGQDLVVETLEEPRLVKMNRKASSKYTIRQPRRSSRPVLSRRTQETRIDGTKWSVPGESHLELFLNAAGSTGAALPTLRLHDISEITGESCSTPLYLENLKRLELDMSVFLAPEGRPYYFLPWMSALTNLEAFKLVQRSSGEHNIDVMGALYPHNYPRLLWLHLENVITDWTALNKFLFGHRHNLTYLKVLNPDCKPSVWSRMRAQLDDSSVFAKLQGGICAL